MDIKAKWHTIWNIASRYKYVRIIIIIGVVLMLLPGKSSETKTNTAQPTGMGDVETVEKRLENLLGMISGTGEVRVLLTTLSGEETIYKTDNRGSSESGSTSTVIVTDSDRNQSGLIQQKNSPIYRGAIVVCAGADRSDVRLAITDAVVKATGLRSDQISVLKMK